MKLVRIVLIFLCLFILKGYNHAFARTHVHSFKGFPVQLIEHKNSLVFNNNREQDIPVEYSLFDEDDNADFAAARKRPQASRFLSYTTLSLKSSFFSFSNNTQRFRERFLYLFHNLYISQRVLRV